MFYVVAKYTVYCCVSLIYNWLYNYKPATYLIKKKNSWCMRGACAAIFKKDECKQIICERICYAAVNTLCAKLLCECVNWNSKSPF